MNKKENDNSDIAIRKLIRIAIICTMFLFCEFIGGFIANSLAIMSDAAHLLTDLSGFVISIFALWIGKKKANNTYTFGYYRAEVIGAFISVFTIWFLTIILVQEAFERIIKPSEINAPIMLLTAVIGLISNLLMCNVLHSGHGHGHNCGHAHSNSHHDKKEYIPFLLSDSIIDIEFENVSVEDLEEYI